MKTQAYLFAALCSLGNFLGLNNYKVGVIWKYSINLVGRYNFHLWNLSFNEPSTYIHPSTILLLILYSEHHEARFYSDGNWSDFLASTFFEMWLTWFLNLVVLVTINFGKKTNLLHQQYHLSRQDGRFNPCKWNFIVQNAPCATIIHPSGNTWRVCKKSFVFWRRVLEHTTEVA